MKLGTFVFPTSAAPAEDGRVIREALDEAALAEEFGMSRRNLRRFAHDVAPALRAL